MAELQIYRWEVTFCCKDFKVPYSLLITLESWIGFCRKSSNRKIRKSHLFAMTQEASHAQLTEIRDQNYELVLINKFPLNIVYRFF